MNKCNLNVIIKKPYKIIIVSDFHAGHRVGLTPTPWQMKYVETDVTKHNKVLKVQKSMWDFFSKEIIKIKKETKCPTLCIVNGDSVDGQNPKNSGIEEITTSILEQVAIAKNIIDFIGANTNIIVAGTDFHCSGPSGTDAEQVLADQLHAKFENHCWIDVHGVVMDFKHYIGSGSTPQSRYNPLGKESTWSKLWQEADLIPDVDYLIRSHVHYYSMIQSSSQTCLTTPSLQGLGSLFGIRKCSGMVDVGFITFDVEPSGKTTMTKHFANLQPQAVKPIMFN